MARLQGPYRFRDNTDFTRGWDLNNQAEVLDFFRDHPYLGRPDEWGNLYQPCLRDSNGVGCWVIGGRVMGDEAIHERES
jgi:hypothetical protein